MGISASAPASKQQQFCGKWGPSQSTASTLEPVYPQMQLL